MCDAFRLVHYVSFVHSNAHDSKMLVHFGRGYAEVFHNKVVRRIFGPEIDKLTRNL
jgi:hypothetical protein